MFSFNDQRGGFATIAIMGGVAVAVAAGGVFYFLRSSPPEVAVVPKEDSTTVFGKETVLSVDAEDALLRSLPRGRANDYCSLLGLEREACADGAEGVCRDLFGSCSIDVSRDSSDTIRQFAEACLVLRTAEGRSQYFAWLDSGDPKPFSLYYAIFGLEEGAFNQKQLADAYQVLLESYFSAASCDNREALRLLTEGYLLLSNAAGRSQYDAWLNGAGGSPFSLYYALLGLRRDTFTRQGSTDAHKALLDQYFSGYYGNNTEALRLLTEAYMVLNDSSSQSAYNTLLDGGLASSFSDISLDSDGDKLFSTLSDLNLSPSQLGTVFGSLGLSSIDLGDVAITLGLSFTDLGGFVGGLNLPPDELSAALSNLNLSSDNLSAVLSGLNPSTDGLSAILSDSNLSVGDLSAVLSGLNLSTDALGTVLSDLNLSTDDLGTVLSDLALSTDDLRAVLGDLTIPPIDLQTLFTNFDIPFLGEGTPFPGVVVPPGDDTDDLPAVAISSKLGQIGVENDGVQPSFLVKVTKGGSPYTPAAPITVALECEDAVRPFSQQTTSLIPAGLPESILLSAREGTTGDLVRAPGVTGYVKCAVVADTAADPTYRPGSPSSATVTVVSGLSGPPCDRPSCPGDPTSGPLPTVSIVAVESRVASGENAVFRISSSSDIDGQLDVQYECSARYVEEAYLGVSEVAIQGGSGQFTATITLPTKDDTLSDTVTCELLDSVKNAYRILGRSASVGVGLLGSRDIAGYDPALPTVSLIAYRTNPGKPRQFSEKVSSTVVGDTDTYIGLVIDDPESDAFGDEGPGSRKKVSNGFLYVLYVTDFGNTISVLPRGGRAVTVGISKDRQVAGLDPPVPLSSAAVGDVVEEHSAYRSPPTTLLHSDGSGSNWSAPFDRVSIKMTADHRVIMRDDAEGNVVVCGYDRGALYCATFEDADAFASRNIFVTAECRKEFSDDRDRQVSDLITGGGRVVDPRSSEPYADPVFGYAPVRRGDPTGDLYTFIRPDGTYDVLGEDTVGPDSALSTIGGINPFLEPDTTFSCELSGGGAEDGYNVGTPYAEVQVRPRATVSLGVHGAQRVADESELFGEPVAHLDRRQAEYEFDSGDSDFLDFAANSKARGGIPRPEESFSVAAGLGASLSVGFLTSFGACAGSSLLNRGISELANRIGLGGFGAVSVRDEKLGLKECVLDSAVSGAVLEVLTAVARDYITWASEGFEDKPLFVKNPTTFYKNLRDDAIGRVIDRSGLGFLCDIGVPNFDAYEATLKINLQQQYLGIATDRPRCTYSDLANNLEDFYDDASDLLRDFNPDYLNSFGFTIDGTASTQDAGTFQFPPSDGFTGNQLDMLSANLDRAMKKTENSSNFLLAVSQVDSDIREARQEFDAAVKPVAQLFNPNDPTSIGAFRECDETENPEGDADCFSLNVSGAKITEMTGKGIGAISDRLLQVDEFGEFGQLVGLAVNATSAGLMKKYLSRGFGHSVDRETADLLSNIEEDIAASLRPSSARKVSLSENWWSVFFERNAFYNDLLNAEMYANDVLTLLQFIGSGLYQDPKRTDDKAYIPPIRPYTAFDTVRHAATNGPVGQFPENSHANLIDFSSAAFSRNYANVYNVEDIRTAFEERKLMDLNGDDNWVKRRLKHIFNSWVNGESDEEKGHRKMVALERFNEVYRFLSNGETRSAYNDFLEKIGLFIEKKPYKRKGGYWTNKDLTDIPNIVKDDFDSGDSVPKRLNALLDVFSYGETDINYPATYFSFSDRIFGSSESRVCADANCGDVVCALPAEERVKEGLGSRCQLGEKDGGALHYCDAERAATEDDCKIVLDPGARGGGEHVPCAVSAGCRGCVRRITEKPKFTPYSADDVESYCPAGGTSDKLLDVQGDFVDIKKLRKIYEATLAVHIRLVGTLDEYRGAPLLSSPIHAYRSRILDAYRADPDSDGLGDGGGWAVVQRETLKKFRDGTMPVYIPLDDDEFDEQKYKDLLGRIGCGEAGTITFQDGAFIRSYQEMRCVLGTVFQDQAYFVVRREHDDLNERRVVYLACGYDDDPAAPGNQSNADKRFRFKGGAGNPRPLPPVTLEIGEDSVIFPVPKPIWLPFDSGDDTTPYNLAGQRIRCSIDVKRTQASADVAVDTLTQVITVSEHNDDSRTTFHSLVRNTLAGLVDPSHETRKDKVAEALFYTYVWGWYTGFIEMPYYSIQGLLSNPPVILTDSKVAVAANIQGNQEVLRRYRFLSSLFANESDSRFSSKNFGFLTPVEARAEYEHSFDDRFNGYFGRALGEFFELLPSMHR